MQNIEVLFLKDKSVAKENLEIQLKSEALTRLLNMAKDFKHKDSFNANRLLLQGGWVVEEGSTRGRPSKEDIRKEAVRLAVEDKQLEEDLKRISNVE